VPTRWVEVNLVSRASHSECACVVGHYAQANINLNFPDNWVNTVSLTLQLLQCYYLIFYTNVVIVMGREGVQ
jgi:hypothetical protein